MRPVGVPALRSSQPQIGPDQPSSRTVRSNISALPICIELRDVVDDLRSKKHKRNVWNLYKDGQVMSDTCSVTVRGYTLNVATNTRPIKIEATKANLQWFLAMVRADAAALTSASCGVVR